MTKAEAKAANIVIRWAFSKRPLTDSVMDDVEELAYALELLADGAHRSLGEGSVTRDAVREWAAPWTSQS